MFRLPEIRPDRHAVGSLLLAAVALFGSSFDAATARAAGPPVAVNSTVPQQVILVGATLGVADPMGTFVVTVRDEDNLPCPDVVVTVDISGAPDVRLADQQPAVTYISCTQASVTTGVDGRATFILVGGVTNTTGNWSPTSTCTFTAGTTPIGIAAVGAFDLDGVDGVTGNDLHIWMGPYFDDPFSAPVMDYTFPNGQDLLDLSLAGTCVLAGGSTNPLTLCGAAPPPGAIQLVGSLALLASPDCQTGSPTSFCGGTHADVVLKVTSPVAITSVTSVLVDLTVIGPPGPLPAFWRFDSGCNSAGLQPLTPGFLESCYDGSTAFANPGDGTTLQAGSFKAATYPAPSGAANEERLQLGLVLMPTYVGPGIPNPGPCTFGYGHVPAFSPSPLVLAFRIRNTPACAISCVTTPPVKLQLNSVTFTQIQPADYGYLMPAQGCPSPAPPVPMEAASADGASQRAGAMGFVEPRIITILPDGSGSNVLSTGDSVTTDVPVEGRTATSAWLAPAAPNPTSGGTLVSFGLPSPSYARVAIVDVAGRVVRVLAEGDFEAGEHRLEWNGLAESGERVRPGVYYCRLVTGGARRSTAIVLAR